MRSSPAADRVAGGLGGAQRANPVYSTRYRHLTGREKNKLTPTQAQTAIAAAILRHLHTVITGVACCGQGIRTSFPRRWPP
jgi:hypothetical protein